MGFGLVFKIVWSGTLKKLLF